MLLETFGFSQPLIDDIRQFLSKSSDDLGESTPAEVGQAFGAAPASLGCAADAGKAREHVELAVNDMMVGLRGYVTALTDMAQRARDVEEVTEAELREQIRRAEACQTPDLASAGVCAPPAGSGASGSGGQGGS